jgi:hypothetical protein
MVENRFVLAQVKGKGGNPSPLSGLGARFFYFRLMESDIWGNGPQVIESAD